MKKEDMFEALNDIDDELIAEKAPKKKGGLAKWIAIAACVCIAVFGAFTLLKPDAAMGGADAGGAYLDEAGLYSVAVFPYYESIENVADAQIITLSETEPLNIENLAISLPKVVPDGYSYAKGYLYDTTMKDGTKYYLLRITYANGAYPEEVVTEDGGILVTNPDDMPAEFMVTLTNYEPFEELDIFMAGDAEKVKNGELWFSVGNGVYSTFEAYDLSAEDVILIAESMG